MKSIEMDVWIRSEVVWMRRLDATRDAKNDASVSSFKVFLFGTQPYHAPFNGLKKCFRPLQPW